MVLQGEIADGAEELLTPTSVVVGDEVEDDRDEKVDVVDSNGLRVQVQEGGDLVHRQGVGVWGGVEDVGPIAVVAILIASSRGGGLALGGTMRQSVADMLVRGLALLDGESGLVLSGLGAVEAGAAFLLARVGIGLVPLSGEAEPLLGLRRGALMTLLLLDGESRGSRGFRHGCSTGEELGRRWGGTEEARSRSRRRGRPWN
jgi:hypothetical protein